MKKMKRILALAMALTLCLGLAATVFAALPSYSEIANRIRNHAKVLSGDLHYDHKDRER